MSESALMAKDISSRNTSKKGQMDNRQVSDQMSESSNKSLFPSKTISKTRQLDNQQMTNDKLSDASEKGHMDKQMMTVYPLSESELSNKMSDKKTSHDKMSLDQKSGMSHPDNFNKDNSKADNISGYELSNKDNSKPDRLPEYELSNKDNSKADDSTKLKVIPQIGHIISPSGEEEEATFDNDDTSTNRHFNSKSTQQKLQKNSATINDISNQEELTKFGKETLSQEAQ
jgi:hypothetical protein